MDNKFKINLDDLLDFIFPLDLQHPLAAARLISYGMYGPLVDGNLRSGPKGNHILTTWELDEMCVQFEREDILQIYLHKGQGFGLLSNEEQEELISQADGRLKQAKGHAMLPKISRTDVQSLFQDVKRDENGLLSFHEMQAKITKFRDDRIKNYKLIYPSLATKNKSFSGSSTKFPPDHFTKSLRRQKQVSEASAPAEMFQSMVGYGEAEIIKEKNHALANHAFKICEVGSSNSNALRDNVVMIRELGPTFRNPIPDRASWNDTGNIKGTQIGSMVKATASRTTWIRKVTMG